MGNRRPFVLALLLGLAAAAALIINLHAGYWPFALALGLIIFVLVLSIGMPIAGSWPVGVGAVGVFLLAFVLLAPIACVSQDHPPTTSCTGLIPISLPGYQGRGSFSPSYAVPLTAALVLTLAFLFLVRRRRSS
jgi:hypothetical protein